MQSKELMIGDWVATKDYKFQVTSVAKASVRTNYLNRVYNIAEKELQPIPLTAEILEKNGVGLHGKTYILQRGGAEIRWRKTDGYTSITSPSNLALGALCSISNGHFCYMHVFQQALRLCGMNDLADGFKV